MCRYPLRAAVLVLLLVEPALAQNQTSVAPSAVSSTAIDLKPMADILVQIIHTLIALFGVPVIWALYNWIREKRGLAKVELTQAQREAAEVVWRRILGHALTKTESLTAQHVASGAFVVDTGNEFLGHALRYGLQYFPDTLRDHKVIGPDGKVNEAVLADILNSRLGLLALTKEVLPQSAAAATSAGPAQEKA